MSIASGSDGSGANTPDYTREADLQAGQSVGTPVPGQTIDPKAPKPLCASGKSTLELRAYFGRKVLSGRDKMRERFRQELSNYMRIYRNQLQGLLPSRLMTTDRIDVNVVYPIIKTLIPQLYFQDPRVMVDSEAQSFTYDIEGTEGQAIPTPENPNGAIQDIVDGPKGAGLLQGAINRNLLAAKIKREAKACILDAHVGFYGAMKTGWDNEQGVYGMADGDAPPGMSQSVQEDMAFAIRLKPWDVFVDPDNFYTPSWIAVRYCVPPMQLKGDSRLQNTANLKGNTTAKQDRTLGVPEKSDSYNNGDPLTEYFEVYVRPCAEYPQGLFFLFTEEVKQDFMYLDKWPYEKSKDYPIKLIYFNPDPEGDLPVPDVRYYISQQKAKNNLRNVEYQYVQRTTPILVINTSGMTKDGEKALKALQSGQTPRVLQTNGNVQEFASGVSFNNLNVDFRRFDGEIDEDITKMVGLAGLGGQPNTDVATVAKIGSTSESIRLNERADIVRDFMTDIVTQWGALYQEFSSEKMSAPIEGQQYPVNFSFKDIRGKYFFRIKAFSMNYEDPAVRRRQYVDLLNLLASPAIAQGLMQKGKMVDLEPIIQATLLSYDDPNVNRVVVPIPPPPMMPGMPGEPQNAGIPGVPPVPGSPGGGNQEGLPINGIAVNQELLRRPMTPSPQKSVASLAREATRTR